MNLTYKDFLRNHYLNVEIYSFLQDNLHNLVLFDSIYYQVEEVVHNDERVNNCDVPTLHFGIEVQML